MIEQIIRIQDIRDLLPKHAEVSFRRKKGQTGSSLEVDVKIVPNVSLKEHEAIVEKICKLYGEDLHEVYTETQGYHFLVYIRLSSTQPTTVEP